MSNTLELIRDMICDYATYVNQMRANVALDGFKAVQRRIYYVTYKMAKDKFLKTATIVGNVIAYYHPHGDASVEDAIVNMVRNRWLIGKGSWGTRCTLEEIRPAASRYTEVKFNTDLDWTMKFVGFADKVLSDLDYEEPLLIPTPIPIGLIGDLVDYPQNQQGIGVGVRTVVPMYRLSDLVEILEGIVKRNEVVEKPPFLGSYVNIIESESLKILETGQGKVVIEPQVTMENKSLHIFALTRNLLNVVKDIKDKITITDHSTKDKTHIIIQPKKYQKLDFEKTSKQIIKKMRTQINYTTYVAIPDDEAYFRVYKIGIVNWLKLQFMYYTECRKRFIEDKIEKLRRQITDLLTIKEIRPHLTKYLQSTDRPDPDEFIRSLPDEFDKTIVNELLKRYSIRKLLTVETDVEPIKEELNEWESRLDTIIDDSLNELKAVAGMGQ